MAVFPSFWGNNAYISNKVKSDVMTGYPAKPASVIGTTPGAVLARSPWCLFYN